MKKVQRLVTYAAGYKAYYKKDVNVRCPYRKEGGCDEHEVSALLHKDSLTGDPQNPETWWWPRSQDFLADASKHSRNPKGVKNMASLLAMI